MSSIRLILASLLHHWRTNLAVAAGVAAGGAVLTGALLVGDSMRGSLRDLTLDRLGPVDEVLVTDRFFRAELAKELAAEPGFRDRFEAAVPAILLEVSLENASQDSDARANRVNLIGCDERFWAMGSAEDPAANVAQPGEGQIVLNRPLANELEVEAGGEVMLRLPQRGNIPGDSLLGKKRDTVQGVRLKVRDVIAADGLGRFAIRPNQQKPLNAYMALGALADQLDRDGRVNAILVTGKTPDVKPPKEDHEALAGMLRPKAVDYGIQIDKLDGDESSYINITSDRMLFEPPIARAIRRALDGESYQQALTYLANTISLERHDEPVTEQGDDGRIVPYSTITAVDFTSKPPLGPFRTGEGEVIPALDDGEVPQIVLNTWAAESLGLPVEPASGDAAGKQAASPTGRDVYVTYFDPESTHGRTQRKIARFSLAAVAALDGAANDRHFTPTVPGVTDERSIDDWNVPFSPFYNDLIRRNRDDDFRNDDRYYRQYGLTPKAFISLATGQELFGSRFGQATSFRIVPSQSATVETLADRISDELKPAEAGFVFMPVKRLGLEASSGATPFNLLFLGFSFFIIVAAVLLVALLFRLGIEQRAEQLGILLAVGLSRRKTAALLAGEGLAVAIVGSLAGVALGVGYGALMLYGLQTLWIEAIVTPFLTLHVTVLSLAIGLVSGAIVPLGAILWAVRGARHVSCRRLLAGQMQEETGPKERRRGWLRPTAWVMIVAAVGLGMAAWTLSEEARAGAFFGAGALVLTGALMLEWLRLRSGATGPAIAVGHGNVLRMALRNAARNPGRSTLSVGLVAATCFLIAAVSAFRMDPRFREPRLDSVNGGFSLVAQTSQPVFENFDTDQGRRRLDFLPKEIDTLEGSRVFALRVRSGDDASCLNLYKPQQPRVLGVPRDLIERGGFAWAGTKAETPAEEKNPWLLLEMDLGKDDDGTPLVPVAIDTNTANYAMHVKLGGTYDILDDRGETMRLKIVALLANGIFQGDLLIGQKPFIDHFPEAGGFRFFLVETPSGKTNEVEKVLNKGLAPYGITVETTGERLARFLAVQNTYLLTFQSLGGLGLLMGTFGLAAVQLRNVLERRGELALMRAAGLRRRTLAAMVMWENGLLLLAGLATGLIAALVAILPHIFAGAAMVPWDTLAAILGAIVAVGLLVGLAGVAAVLRTPLLPALRGD